MIFNLLEALRGAVPECLPRAMLARLDLPDRETALREVHFPPEGTPFAQLQSSATPAHRRLIFEELFFLELGLELKRRRMRERAGIGFATTDKVREAIREVLPFHPTTAQKRALGEIVADMRAAQPHAAAAAGRCGLGQDHRRAAGHAGGHGKRLPGGADGAHRDSGHAAFSGRAQAAGDARRASRASCC